MKKSKIKQKVIENADGVVRLVANGILTKEEVRRMMGLKERKIKRKGQGLED